MEDQRLAVHRTIVVVDVEGFGDQRRTNGHQVTVRDGLYRAMQKAFSRAGIPWEDCGREDRGDGMLILVPAELPKGLLAGSLPAELVSALCTHNGMHPGPERIRLRMALHAGEVVYDDHGVTAASVNLAFRLLDCVPLREALAGSSGVLAVIASSWFFEEVVRHSPIAAGAAYRPVPVAVKETTTTGWICLPDQPYPSGQAGLEDLTTGVRPGRPPAVALRSLPRDTAAFTGRTRELEGLLAAVVGTTRSPGVIGIHAVDGMAGIGKTTFAVRAAHRLAARFPDGQIFLHLHAHTAGQRPVDPADALTTLLLAAGVAPQRIPPGLQARSAAWRGCLAGKKVLLVLDDAASTDQVRPLLPGSAGCLVLVTSRRKLTALEEAAPIGLGALPPGDAANLFVRLAARPDLEPGHREVAEVARLCGCLPLAIRLAGAGLRHHPAWTVGDLAAELATAHGRLTALQAEDVSVAAAFDLSYQDLTSAQKRLFRRLGLHPGTDIDAYASAALDNADLHATQQRLGELYDHNLISEPARGRYRFHDLLREHARTLTAADDAVENQAAIGRLLDYYLHTAVAASRHIAWRTPIAGAPPPGSVPAWAPELRTEEEAIAWLGTERPNLHACTGYAAAHGLLEHAIRIPVAMSDVLHIQGHWNEAIALGKDAVTAARAVGDRHSQAWASNQLGIVQRRTGDYPAAAANLAQALELFDGLGDRHGQAWALNHLGVLWRLTADYPAAATSLVRALGLCRDIGDRHGQAWALNQLCVVQRLTGDYSAAAASVTEALELFRDIGDRHGQASALDDLCVVQRLTGDYPAAAASLAQALELFHDIGDRHGEAWALNHLGMVQAVTGDHPAAAGSLTQALELFRDLGERRGVAGASINLGELRFLSSAYREARGYYTQALGIARAINAPVEQARAHEGIGRCHSREGDPGQASTNLRQALAIYRRIGAPEAQRVEAILSTGDDDRQEQQNEPTPYPPGS